MSQSHTSGFTLIEAVLALALTAIVVGGILNGMLYADRVLATVSTVFQGRLMADECIAVMRWIRDADGYDALAEGVFGLSVEGGRWEMIGEPDSVAGHSREVRITGEGNEEKRVECFVEWTENGRTASVSLVTLLSR